MFNKKPRRNFRQRKQSSSEDEEQRKAHVEENENVKASVVNASSKAAPGRGISCSSKREVTPPKADSSDEEHRENPELTEEKSKKNDGTNWKTKSVLSFSVEKENEESSFQLKRTSEKTVLFQSRKKEEASPARNTFNKGGGGGISSASPRHDHCDEALPQSPKHNSSSEDINSGDGNSEDSNGDDDEDVTNGGGVESSSATSESDSTCSAPKPSDIIPNAKEIKAARKQRSAIRAQKEFISLRRDRPSSNGSTPDHYSREDEEERVDDDDDNEPDDHERRIEFAPRLKSIRERIAEKLGTSGESLDGSDEEEQELWEETQIEKGLKRRPGEQSPSGSDSSSNIRQDRVRNKKRSSRNKIPKSLPPVSVSTIKRRITGKLDSLKEVHRARQAELRRMAGDVENATASMELLEDVSSESQLKFYRNMTLYIHNLVECLQEKVVEINALEVELHTLLSDQMEALLAQTRERIKEQADRLQQLSYNTDEQSSSTVETDRKNNKDPKSEDCDLPEDAQLSPEEEEQLQTRIADIQSRSKDVFSDVQDDFCCVKNILARFEEWRRSYSESYHNAYISLCLPKLLNPIIRHQLLSWNPLQESSCGEFENHPWFSAVETFCHGHGHEELEHTDRQTLSSTIEKTVLPKMTAFVELVWDPMSHQQSASLSGVCHRLKEDYSIFQGEQSKPVKGFIEAVIQRLRNCVDEDVFIPLYPKRCLDDRSSPQCRFRDQQFWTGVKLLGNMGRWDLLLPEAVLKELMLDKLLNRYLMITLCSQTLSNTTSACKKIAESFPISWFEGDSQCLPQLQNFRNHIVQDVHRICKQQPPGDPDTK
ncbi:GC-rich sequence DNA-binding factor 2 [Oryzias melastigma]|uniref:GC-rich sequence DNA-binding factor 2 n=1 Tax=Oryzias melastigma TaxID=30732 RepID=A0A834FDX0_ORYME|nr:GC-rich sequence DNA-binding factor 2 [Oryzias melastigma]